MPQLRHADTSVLIAESNDPLDLALIAREVGVDRVIFDDVGPTFDVDAAIRAAEQRAQPNPTEDLPDSLAVAAQERDAARAEHADRIVGPVASEVAGLLDAVDDDTTSNDVEPVVID